VFGLSNQAHHAQLQNPGVQRVSLVLGAQQSRSGLIDRMHAHKTKGRIACLATATMDRR
jgi:hypothetical protein